MITFSFFKSLAVVTVMFLSVSAYAESGNTNTVDDNKKKTVYAEFGGEPTYKPAGVFAAFAKDNRYVVDIKFDQAGTFRHNINQFIGVIDWGDGTQTTYVQRVNNPSHDYAEPGRYRVIAKGKATQLDSNYGSKVIVDVLHIGGDMGITTMANAFINQKNLTFLREGIFDELKDVADFHNAFLMFDDDLTETACQGEVSVKKYAKGLRTIPEGLFDKCEKAHDFSACFMGCDIKEIPEGLFEKQTQLRNVAATFCNTEIRNIPLGLFDNNQLIENMRYTFWGCKDLKGQTPFLVYKGSLYDSKGKFKCWILRKVDLFNRGEHSEYYKEIKEHAHCFTGCTGLEDWDKIPEDWKN